MSRILAIDVGTKRIGFAVTDPLRIIASGLTTVPANEAMDFVKKYCATEPVESFVVGLPLHDDGSPAQSTPAVEAFCRELKKAFPEKEIHRQDERDTSNQARKIMLQSGVPRMKRREKARVDKIAAALILERYMEENHWN